MFHVHADKRKQLLTMSFSRRVDMGEMNDTIARVKSSLLKMEPGFELLTDLSDLEVMDAGCAVYIAQIMDLCSKEGVHAITMVVPDPAKDIGFAIMSRFHHRREVRTMTFESLADAMRSLAA